MAFKKLTYGSKGEYNNYVYFSFYGSVFDTERITHALNIAPTSVMIKKDPVPKITVWKYAIDAGMEVNIEQYTSKLVSIFEDKIAEIQTLKQELGVLTRLQFVLYIDIDPEISTPCFGLDARAIQFLDRTQTTVDFDLYKADTLGLLQRL